MAFSDGTVQDFSTDSRAVFDILTVSLESTLYNVVTCALPVQIGHTGERVLLTKQADIGVCWLSYYAMCVTVCFYSDVPCYAVQAHSQDA